MFSSFVSPPSAQCSTWWASQSLSPQPGKRQPVAVGERAAEGGRHGAGAAADVEHRAVRAVGHHHLRRVAGQPPGRFRRNVLPVLQRRAAPLAPRRQRLGVDVDDHLVAIPAGARVEPAGQRALGDQPEGVGPPLLGGGVVVGGAALAAPVA
jgi:hypothetical protein